jgi:hypothetical protein
MRIVTRLRDDIPDSPADAYANDARERLGLRKGEAEAGLNPRYGTAMQSRSFVNISKKRPPALDAEFILMYLTGR